MELEPQPLTEVTSGVDETEVVVWLSVPPPVPLEVMTLSVVLGTRDSVVIGDWDSKSEAVLESVTISDVLTGREE